MTPAPQRRSVFRKVANAWHLLTALERRALLLVTGLLLLGTAMKLWHFAIK